MEQETLWYRAKADVQISAYHPYDERFYPLSKPRVSIFYESFPVIRRTPKGVWLQLPGYYGDKRFVLRDARKRFACPTKEEALESLHARTKRRVLILGAQLKKAQILDDVLAGRAKADLDGLTFEAVRAGT